MVKSVKLTMCIHDHPWFSQGNPRMPWLIMAYHPVKLARNSPMTWDALAWQRSQAQDFQQLIRQHFNQRLDIWGTWPGRHQPRVGWGTSPEFLRLQESELPQPLVIFPMAVTCKSTVAQICCWCCGWDNSYMEVSLGGTPQIIYFRNCFNVLFHCKPTS